MPAELNRLIDRTFDRFRRVLKQAAASARIRLTGQLHPDLPDDDLPHLRRQFDACLEARGGEVSVRAEVAELVRAYLDLSAIGRQRFLWTLAVDYGVDRQALIDAAAQLGAAEDGRGRQQALIAMRRALMPGRLRILKKSNILEDGVKFLVDLRAELMGFAKSVGDGEDAGALAALDGELKELLAAWFDVGFLNLERITWKSPAALLEKLIRYEAVHRIRSWDDLKNRLDSDRRCYAFFHPRMPDEPLIFLEVALVTGMAGNVQKLLDESAPAQDAELADTAVFYSISNCQAGLAGVNFGAFLIKRVVDDLGRDFPKIKTFATLSPIPGFRSWLKEKLRNDLQPYVTDEEFQKITVAAGDAGDARPSGDGGRADRLDTILERRDWPGDTPLATALQGPLLRLCAQYLLEERGGDRALDRVAHFHLTNGARVERLNWLADLSEEGLAQSAGLMVNYRYKLDDMEANHEAYSTTGRVAAAAAVRRLLKA